MSNKQQLKPLNHKKILNNADPITKPPLSKEIFKSETNKSITTQPIKPPLAKKSSNGDAVKPIKYEKSMQRSTKVIEHFECDDFDLQIQDNHYFESQLQKNIKTEILSKTGKPQAKAQILLPKLQSDLKMRNMKDLQKQMDQEMSRMLDKEDLD